MYRVETYNSYDCFVLISMSGNSVSMFIYSEQDQKLQIKRAQSRIK